MKIPSLIEFHRHNFNQDEIKAVTQVLKGKWITGGPFSLELEEKLKDFLASKQVLTVNSATSALFLVLKVFGIGKGDEVITSPYSFVATANTILETGAKVVFADIGENYLIDPNKIQPLINARTKAILTVDYGGYPCDYEKIHHLLDGTSFKPNNHFQEKLQRPLILADSAHSIGSLPLKPSLKNQADIHCYSFHAVKNITCGDGGAISIVNPKLTGEFSTRLRQARLHGINNDVYNRKKNNQSFYDMENFGYKFNLPDIQSAIALAQLKKINLFKKKKLSIFEQYQKGLNVEGIYIRKNLPYENKWDIHPHLYTIEVKRLLTKNKQHKSFKEIIKNKLLFFSNARKNGVELNFHYKPIPLMSYYQKLGYNLKKLPLTEEIYPTHISLPFYTQLKENQVNKIIHLITKNS